jgi:hypothetical protein
LKTAFPFVRKTAVSFALKLLNTKTLHLFLAHPSGSVRLSCSSLPHNNLLSPFFIPQSVNELVYNQTARAASIIQLNKNPQTSKYKRTAKILAPTA